MHQRSKTALERGENHFVHPEGGDPAWIPLAAAVATPRRGEHRRRFLGAPEAIGCTSAPKRPANAARTILYTQKT